MSASHTPDDDRHGGEVVPIDAARRDRRPVIFEDAEPLPLSAIPPCPPSVCLKGGSSAARNCPRFRSRSSRSSRPQRTPAVSAPTPTTWPPVWPWPPATGATAGQPPRTTSGSHGQGHRQPRASP